MLTYDNKQRVREIIAVVAEELNIKIDNGVISSDHIHIFANYLFGACVICIAVKFRDQWLLLFYKSFLALAQYLIYSSLNLTVPYWVKIKNQVRKIAIDFDKFFDAVFYALKINHFHLRDEND